MATLLTGDTEIATRLAPLRSVRRNPTAPGAFPGQEVCQLVTQRAVDLFRARLDEPWVERDELADVISAAGRAAQAAAPMDADGRGEGIRAERPQELTRSRFER